MDKTLMEKWRSEKFCFLACAGIPVWRRVLRSAAASKQMQHQSLLGVKPVFSLLINSGTGRIHQFRADFKARVDGHVVEDISIA